MVAPGEGEARAVGDDLDPGRPSSVRRWVAWASVVVVVLASLASSAALALRQQADRDDEEQAEADAAAQAVEDLLSSTTHALAGAAGLVAEDGTVSEDRFSAFASGLAGDTRLLTLAYSPVVDDADRAAFEFSTGVEIADLHEPAGELDRAGRRDRYAPRRFVYPDTEEFRTLLGLDLLADSERGEATAEARTSGNPSLARIEIAVLDEPGVLLIQPLTMPDRIQATGFVTATYRVDELASAVAPLLRTGATIAILDESGTVLASSSDEQISGSTAAAEVAGLHLTAVVRGPEQDLWVAPLVVLVGGSLLALFLTLVFGQSFRYERRIEAAQHRTLELLELTSLLTRSLSSEEVAEAVLGRGRPLVGARGAVLAVLTDDGRRLRVLHHLGLTPAGEAGLDGLTTVNSLPGPVERGEAIWLSAPSLRAGGEPTATSFATGAAAAALVPLVADGRLVGVTGWTFDAQRVRGGDRVLARSMAAQTARALDRAARHDREHDLALELQRRLLPVDLPSIPALPVAVRYRAAARGVVVGGDWYDAFELPDGSVAFVVGDVVGRGPPAAAVMVQLRSALKGYVSRDRDPAAALRSLHQVVPLVEDALCSTCCVVVADPVGGGVAYARAGHPYPLVVGPHGFRFLRGGAGAPLGVAGGTAQTADVDRLQPGEHLLLYTDGAVERRGEHLDIGLDRLGRAAVAAFAAASDGPGSATDPDAFCDRLLELLFPDSDPADDVALLVVAWGARAATHPVAATPDVRATPAS